MNHNKKMYGLLFVVSLCCAQDLYSMDIDTSQRMTLSQFNGPRLTLYSADKTTSETFNVIDSLQFNPEPSGLYGNNLCWLHAYGYDDNNKPSVMEYCSSGKKSQCFVCFDIPSKSRTTFTSLPLIDFAEYPYLLEAILKSNHIVEVNKSKIYYFSAVEFKNKDLVIRKDLNKSNRVFSVLKKDYCGLDESVWKVIFAKISEK